MYIYFVKTCNILTDLYIGEQYVSHVNDENMSTNKNSLPVDEKLECTRMDILKVK
jgi:hypothetical protein